MILIFDFLSNLLNLYLITIFPNLLILAMEKDLLNDMDELSFDISLIVIQFSERPPPLRGGFIGAELFKLQCESYLVSIHRGNLLLRL